MAWLYKVPLFTNMFRWLLHRNVSSPLSRTIGSSAINHQRDHRPPMDPASQATAPKQSLVRQACCPSSTPESVFLRQFVNSLRDLESSLGITQHELQTTILGSIPLLNADLSSNPKPLLPQVSNLKNNGIEYLTWPLSSNSSSSFEMTNQCVYKFQQKLLAEEQQKMTKELAEKQTLRHFRSVRPREAFLVLSIAGMMSPHAVNFNRPKHNRMLKQSDTLRHYLMTLLNIVQLIKEGSRLRTKNELTTENYRWSVVKGNFYFYNVTYCLLRLNMQEVTQLMTDSLQEFSSVLYWLEQEANNQFVRYHSTKHDANYDDGGGGGGGGGVGGGSGYDDERSLYVNAAVRSQLATGELYPIWQSVVNRRDGHLLAAGCKAIAALLGKDCVKHYDVADELSTLLAYIMNLVTDYHYFQHECAHTPPLLASSQEELQQWNAQAYLEFILRLPVLLHLKEATTNRSLALNTTETNCHKMVTNVMANIKRSSALPKTFALIEYYVNEASQLVGKHYEPSPMRQAFLGFLQSCTRIE